MIPKLLIVALVPLVAATFRLQILHNGDMHSRFNETEENPKRWRCTKDSKNCFGGFARIKQAVYQFTGDENPPTIFLNAGDNYHGTPYVMVGKRDLVTALVNALYFTALCFGNHDFDHGINGIVDYVSNLNAPVLACNLNLETEERLKKLENLKPSIILPVGTQRIGVIGYLTPRTRDKSDTENLLLFDEIESVRKEARRLIDEENVKIIIALGHTGIERDIEIAEQVEEISMIVGGDSHTLLHTPKESPPSIEEVEDNYPIFVTQKSGKKVPIVHAGAFTKYLGRLIVEFDENTGNVVSAEGNTVLLDGSIDKDQNMQDWVDLWTKPIDQKLSSNVGYLRVPLYFIKANPLEIETTAGNLITDAFQNYSVRRAAEQKLTNWTTAPIAIFNRGAMNVDLHPDEDGFISLADIFALVQYENQLYEVDLKGSTIWEVMGYAPAMDFDKEGILDCAGMKVVYDLDEGVEEPTASTSRLSSVHVLCKECSVPRYEALDLDKTYTIITVKSVLQPKGVYEKLRTEWIRGVPLQKTDTEAVLEYFQQIKYVYPKIGGRIEFRRVPKKT